MKKYKLVIFDWDGTLMDSVDRIVSSMRSAAVDVGLPMPDAEKVKSINPNIKTIHYVAPQVWVWREGRVKNFKIHY